MITCLVATAKPEHQRDSRSCKRKGHGHHMSDPLAVAAVQEYQYQLRVVFDDEGEGEELLNLAQRRCQQHVLVA